MKILITGNAGFIGSNIADRLIEEVHKVAGVDNFLTGNIENINEKVHQYYYSLTDEKQMDIVFRNFKPEMVFHCAASYNDADNWNRDIETNCVGTSNIVKCCQKYNVKKLVYFQTALCYGDFIEQPITLSHPINPTRCSYAITKTTAEQIIDMSGIPCLTFRMANVYGPRHLSSCIPTFYLKLKNREKTIITNTKRSFVYISDLVDLIVKTMDSKITGVYHLSTLQEVSIKFIFEAMAELMNIDIRDIEVNYQEPKEDNVKTILLDNLKTKMDFSDWYPKVGIIDGLKRSIEWYNKNKFDKTFTHLKLGK